MKKILSFLIILCLNYCAWGQNQKCASFDLLMNRGNDHYKAKPARYQDAINAYMAAMLDCPDKAKQAQDKISLVFKEIEGLKNSAEKAEIKAKENEQKALIAQQNTASALAETEKQKQIALQNEQKALDAQKATEIALIETEKQKQIAQTNLDIANKLSKHFYFYNDRFALVSKGDIFYFIDKRGDKVEKLQEWTNVEMFNPKTGLARVRKGNEEHLLDTLGNAYLLAFNISQLQKQHHHFTALEMKYSDNFPTDLQKHSQLKVLIFVATPFWDAARDYNPLREFPAQIGKLKNLTTLVLRNNHLTSLPAQIGELRSLTSLDLENNRLMSLPAQIGELKNLTILNLERNQLTSLPAQIEELKNLTSLYLSGNPLQSLPASFFTLKGSETLKYDELVKTAVDSSNFAFAQQIYEGIKDKKELLNTNYGNLSFYFVFAHCFEGAIWAGERYVANGEKEIGFLSNLAMGYLYNGEYEKAKAMYAQYKNEKNSKGKTGKEIFLGDLRAVAAAKVPAKKPADVEKMIRFLEETP